jgi:hypothetical protein
MKNDFYMQEQIDAFLNGELSEAECLVFEDKMQKDPLLKQEVAFQQDIISSLHQYRKMQLKSRLEKIEVAPVKTGYLRLKWGAIATGIVVVASSGLYFYKKATEPAITEQVTLEAPAAVTPAPGSSQAQVITPAQPKENKTVLPAQPEVKKDVAKATQEVASITRPAPSAAKKTKEADSNMIAADPDFELIAEQPVPAHPGSGLKISSDSGKGNPTGLINTTSAGATIDNTIDVKLLEDKDYSYHYQYYNNKLFLYGNFHNRPYELLEINAPEGKTLYMYHDSTFYLLENNKLEPTPLSKIINKELEKELKQKMLPR